MGVAEVGRKNLDVKVKMWFLGSPPSVVFDLGRLTMRDINPSLDATCLVFRVHADDLGTVTVDAPSERVSDGILVFLDHARPTIDRVFCEMGFIKDYPLPVMVTS